MKDYPKHIKRKLRELNALAYEEELRQALLSLGEQFDAWKQGKLSAGELDQLIHRYDSSIAKELSSRYDNNPFIDMVVAYAFTQGILKQEDIPEEVIPYLQNAVKFYNGQST